VTEHADSLGNSFQILTEQLYNREQQIIKLSTTTADLQAENDELTSEKDYLKEQVLNYNNLNKQVEVKFFCFAKFRHFFWNLKFSQFYFGI